MKRHLFSALAGMSLLLCLATAGVWVLSYMAPWTWVTTLDTGYHFYMSSERGAFDIGNGGYFEHWPVHYWKLALLFLVLPARRAQLKYRQYVRSRIGFCRRCGYDLRATPERCPECGTVPRELPHNPPMQRTATASNGAVE